MKYEGKYTATKGKTSGLSAKKAGAASGHIFRTTGDGQSNKKSGLAKVTGRGKK